MDVTLDLELLASRSQELPMTYIAVRCLHCQSEQIVKRGKTAQGTQRYLCQNTLCAVRSFLLNYRNRGCLPEIKQHIIDMSLNASGVRDTARSLHICPNTVLRELKKKEVALESVNTALLRTLKPTEITVNVERAGEAEMDEMWSFVGNKRNRRWLWHAIDHHTGKVLAYVFGRRQDTVFLQLKALLAPFGITNIIPIIGAPTRVTSILKSTPRQAQHAENRAQALTLRTRISARPQDICFSKSTQRRSSLYSLIAMPLDGGETWPFERKERHDTDSGAASHPRGAIFSGPYTGPGALWLETKP